MKVVIVGGGISGLTLAHTLLKKEEEKEKEKEGEELEVVILDEGEGERERERERKKEDNFVVAFHQWGCDALEKAGLKEALSPLLFEGGVRNVLMKDFNCSDLVAVPNFMTLKFEKKSYSSLISRGELKKNIKKRLPNGVISYNSKVVGMEEREGEGEGGKVMVKLEGGGEVMGDIVVGADGERSTIRTLTAPQLAPKSVFGGIICVHGFVFQPKFPRNRLFLKACTSLVRITACCGVSIVLYCSPTTPSSSSSVLWWSVSMPKEEARELRKEEEEWTERDEDEKKQRMLFLLTKILEKNVFNGDFMRIIEKSDVVSPVYEMKSIEKDSLEGPKKNIDPTIQWMKTQKRKKTCITLVGDAAHKTTTQAGLGATAAIVDAIELAECLMDNDDDENDDENMNNNEVILKKLRTYERKMEKRATFYVKESLGNTEILHVVRTGMELWMWWLLMVVVGWCVWVIYILKKVFRVD